MSIYVGVFQYVFMKTLKHTCIKYKLFFPTRQTILQLTNMEMKLQDTAQVFFSNQYFNGFYATFTINFTPSFLFPNFW